MDYLEELDSGTIERLGAQRGFLLSTYHAELAKDPTSRATESSRSNVIALWHTIRQIYGKAVARDVANLVYTNTKLLPATQVGVQTRAYELYELRGRIDGRAEQDWYRAETDLTASSKQWHDLAECADIRGPDWHPGFSALNGT
jgi:Protein of unknown function (DUF2934)